MLKRIESLFEKPRAPLWLGLIAPASFFAALR
jgi:hypothetical protein